MKISVLVVVYNNDILQAVGFSDVSDSMLLHFNQEVMDAIKDDKATKEIIKGAFIHSSILEGSTYVAETEIYHLLGSYGNLHIYTTVIDVDHDQLRVV